MPHGGFSVVRKSTVYCGEPEGHSHVELQTFCLELSVEHCL